MKIEQKKWTKKTGWITISEAKTGKNFQIVFVFGGSSLIKDRKHFNYIKSLYPKSHIIGCSTAGEIINNEVLENSLVVTAVYFENTKIKFSETEIKSLKDSYDAGKRLAKSFDVKGLSHVMVFSDGLKVNGTSFVRGMTENLPAKVSVTGGLVGDGSDFKQTYVGLDKVPTEGKIVAMGFYGKSLKVGYGSLGGWDNFGPERIITKSDGNVLYELDGKPALKLYKEYLGNKAKDLPGSGLLFPLSLKISGAGGDVEVVRTILGIDEKNQSITFAGDMPEGAYTRLMKANFERLIDGASGAASMSNENIGKLKPELAILISCVGRRLVLKERTVDEIDAVRKRLGKTTAITGFYSYGEICPTASTEKQCQLHNQTMTITTFREK